MPTHEGILFLWKCPRLQNTEWQIHSVIYFLRDHYMCIFRSFGDTYVRMFWLETVVLFCVWHMHVWFVLSLGGCICGDRRRCSCSSSSSSSCFFTTSFPILNERLTIFLLLSTFGQTPLYGTCLFGTMSLFGSGIFGLCSSTSFSSIHKRHIRISFGPILNTTNYTIISHLQYRYYYDCYQ